MSNQSVERFIQYIRGKKGQKPMTFILSDNGLWSTWWYCGHAAGCRDGTNYEPTIRECERATGTDCGLFARRYTILWKNGINPGKGNESKIRMKWSDDQIRAKLTELGFLGSKTTSSSSSNTIKEKKTKIAKKNIIEKKSIAISWSGYEDLILGTADAEETDDGRTLMNLQLPNNDGSCEGTYLLQNGGLGTWQISCTNKMGAAGTLKWKKNGTVTGHGLDYNNNKVKFTVSQKS